MKTLSFSCFLLFVGWLFCCRNLSAQTNYPVAVNTTSLKQKYSEIARSIDEIDFRNYQYSLDGETYVLRNGSSHKDQRIKGTDAKAYSDAAVRHIWYFEGEKEQGRYALISIRLTTTAASSSDRGYVLLFEVVDNHPVITQQFEYDLQAPGTGATFDDKSRLLTIKARAQDDSPHCCPENLETDEFKWTGGKFNLTHRGISKLANVNSP